MTQNPEATQVIGALYEAFGRGDLDAMLALIDENVEWCQTEPGAPHPVIENGRGIGHDAVRAYFATIAERMAITKFVPLTMAANGDTVLSLLELEFADPTVGKTVGQREVHVFRVRNGKVVYYAPILDTAVTAPAFGHAR